MSQVYFRFDLLGYVSFFLMIFFSCKWYIYPLVSDQKAHERRNMFSDKDFTFIYILVSLSHLSWELGEHNSLII